MLIGPWRPICVKGFKCFETATACQPNVGLCGLCTQSVSQFWVSFVTACVPKMSSVWSFLLLCSTGVSGQSDHKAELLGLLSGGSR